MRFIPGFLMVLVLGYSMGRLVIGGPWMNVGDSPRQRASALLAQMTLDEKLAMVRGYFGPYIGNVKGNERLNIPALHLEDGPQGVADETRQVTAWPSALTVVATWDIDLMHQYSAAMGKEQRGKGTNVMLGPMVNIARVPVGGRNFESFGEDPYLSSEMARASIQGIQSQGVIACVKHFINNNQEHERARVSANVDERTEWEIYYPPFKAAVEAGVGVLMCSYNRVNNTYACQNEQTLRDIKQTMGFQGWVVSDWGATLTTIEAANAGLDMQMPFGTHFGEALKLAVEIGKVSRARVDDMALRILTSMFAVGLFDNPQTGNLTANVQSPEHTILARTLAAQANVLLKNSGNLLPIDASKVRNIAVLGDDGDLNPTYAGGGSGHVNPPYVVSPLKGIANRTGSGVTVTYAPTNDITGAVRLAKAADIAIVFVSTESHEGSDRANLSLSDAQNNLVRAVAAAQLKTVVVIHGPGAVLMPWIDSVPAVIFAFFPGQEDGNAIASVLFGDVNPSGKLPLTFPIEESQTPVNTTQQYPGINREADYSEKLLVGYRWYDALNLKPLFPFGFGLSYTTFDYRNLEISGNVNSGISVGAAVKNTGKVSGAEVAQLYIGFPSYAGEPPKQLKGFQKVFLLPGEFQRVSFSLQAQNLSIWDVNSHNWKLVTGTFTVFVGSSSRDLRLNGFFNVSKS